MVAIRALEPQPDAVWQPLVPPPLPLLAILGPLARGLVACTGAQFCGVGLIETKNRAVKLVERLEAAYDIPETVRIHWSGCPNSCGQSQVRRHCVPNRFPTLTLFLNPKPNPRQARIASHLDTECKTKLTAPGLFLSSGRLRTSG